MFRALQDKTDALNLVVQESVLLYLRYAAVRKDEVTAGDAVTPP
jgi:hypothetical protein